MLGLCFFFPVSFFIVTTPSVSGPETYWVENYSRLAQISLSLAGGSPSVALAPWLLPLLLSLIVSWRIARSYFKLLSLLLAPLFGLQMRVYFSLIWLACSNFPPSRFLEHSHLELSL